MVKKFGMSHEAQGKVTLCQDIFGRIAGISRKFEVPKKFGNKEVLFDVWPLDSIGARCGFGIDTLEAYKINGQSSALND